MEAVMKNVQQTIRKANYIPLSRYEILIHKEWTAISRQIYKQWTGKKRIKK